MFFKKYIFAHRNALRRILLSSMPGCAIVEAEIEGVLHEYTSIEGVQEDVVDVLLNLKGVAIKMHTRNEAELTLSKKGPGPVTAGDIVCVTGVENIGISDTLFFMTLNRVGAGLQAIINTSYSPSIIFLSVVFLGEPLTIRTVVGALLVVAGVSLATTSTH